MVHKILIAILTVLGGHPSEAQVTVDLTHELSIGGVHELRRSRYFNTHNAPKWGAIPAGLHDVLENEWRTTPGRSMWHLKHAPQNPDRPDQIASAFFEKPLAGAAGLKRWQAEHPTTDMILAFGRFPDFMSVKGRKHSGTPNDFETAAKTLRRVVENFYTHAGRGPAYVEVLNESDIPQNFCWHWDDDAWAKNCAYHNLVAQTIKADFPDVMVGGPAQCTVRYQLRDFRNWNRQLGYFIANSGEQMDFLSFHVYDYKMLQSEADRRGGPGGDSRMASGPRIRAVFDLVEHTCQSELGEMKPILVSEYGGLGQEKHFGWKGTRAEAEWMNLRACNALLVDLLDMPDRLLKSVPFMLPVAPWNEEYSFLLWRKQEDGKMAITSLGRFYQLFSELEGGRIPVTSSDRNLRVQGFRDDQVVHLVLNHLGGKPIDVELDHLLPPGISYAEAKRSSIAFVDGQVRYLKDEALPNVDRIQLLPDETARLSFRLNQIPEKQPRLDERRAFASERLVDINGKAQTFQISIPKKDIEGLVNAKLRSGVARTGGFKKNPRCSINGKTIPVDLQWSSGVPTFWGTVDIPLDSNLLKNKNVLRLKFDQAGGQVSTASVVYRVAEN